MSRQRHMGENNGLMEADRWLHRVKERCTAMNSELKITARWNDADGSTVLVVITGLEVIVKEETGQANRVIDMAPKVLSAITQAPEDARRPRKSDSATPSTAPERNGLARDVRAC